MYIYIYAYSLSLLTGLLPDLAGRGSTGGLASMKRREGGRRGGAHIP